jgi:hypothetical protein
MPTHSLFALMDGELGQRMNNWCSILRTMVSYADGCQAASSHCTAPFNIWNISLDSPILVVR